MALSSTMKWMILASKGETIPMTTPLHPLIICSQVVGPCRLQPLPSLPKTEVLSW